VKQPPRLIVVFEIEADRPRLTVSASSWEDERALVVWLAHIPVITRMCEELLTLMHDVAARGRDAS
jgi:hypothetical protein